MADPFSWAFLAFGALVVTLFFGPGLLSGHGLFDGLGFGWFSFFLIIRPLEEH